MYKILFTRTGKKLSSQNLHSHISMLPENFKERILRYKYWRNVQASLFGKLILKKGLADMGINSSLEQIKYNKYGKPYLNNNLNFNISHSGSTVICVITNEGKAGIDIEQLKPIDFSLFRRIFSENEWNTIIESKNQRRTFYSLWCAKEALVKANGKAFRLPLQKIILNNHTSYFEEELWHYKRIDIHRDYVVQLASNAIIPIDIKAEEVIIYNSLVVQ